MSALSWMRAGAAVFSKTLDGLSDAELDEPTDLPGWSGRTVLAHVHYNAEALRRLTTWAHTGTPTPMYAGVAQRGAEIASGSQLPAVDLRLLVRSSQAALEADLAELDDEQWQREVVTIQGRTIPASQIPWLRAREVCVHAVDLGASFDDLPQDFNAALVAEVAAKRAAGDEAAALAAWLTGRAAQAPSLGPWL